MQTKQIKHAQMKRQLCEEYLHHTKSKLKTKLNGKHTIKAINTYATPVLTFSFGIVKWTATELENLKTILITVCEGRPCVVLSEMPLPMTGVHRTVCMHQVLFHIRQKC